MEDGGGRISFLVKSKRVGGESKGPVDEERKDGGVRMVLQQGWRNGGGGGYEERRGRED